MYQKSVLKIIRIDYLSLMYGWLFFKMYLKSMMNICVIENLPKLNWLIYEYNHNKNFLTDNLRFFHCKPKWLAIEKSEIISEGISIVNKWAFKFRPFWPRVQHHGMITILYCSVAVALWSGYIIGPNSHKTDNKAIGAVGTVFCISSSQFTEKCFHLSL